MKGFETIFANVWNMGLIASLVILLVLIARVLLRRAPKVFSYVLWAAVAFRLVCPVAASTPFSIFNQTRLGSQEVRLTEQTVSNASSEESGAATDAELSGKRSDTAVQSTAASVQESESVSSVAAPTALSKLQSIWKLTQMGNFIQISQGNVQNDRSLWIFGHGFQGAAVFAVYDAVVILWAAGIFVMLFLAFRSYRRTREKIRAAVRLEGNVFECDQIRSPFVFGILRPRIYIPFRLSDHQKRMILAHERCHIRRGDFLIRPFAFLLLCIYWCHPLVWAAYFCMSRDMELSCDENVVRSMEADERKEYGKTLYSFAVNRRFPDLAALAFGEGNTKKRIQNALDCRNPGRWEKAFLCIFCAGLFAVCATNTMAAENAESVTWKWNTDSQEALLTALAGDTGAEFTYEAPESARSFGFLIQTYLSGSLLEERKFFAGGIEEGGAESMGSEWTASVQVAQGGIARKGSGRLKLAMDLGEHRDLQGEIEIGGYSITSEYFTKLPENLTFDTMDYSVNGNGADGQTLSISLEQNIPLVFWRQGDGVLPAAPSTCEELLENPQAVQNTELAVVLSVWFSEEPYGSQSETETAISDEEQAVYEARTPYIGDAPAVGSLLGAMKYAGFLSGDFTMELGTEEAPYYLEVKFEELSEEWTAGYANRLSWAGTILLALVDNLSEVRWSFPDDGQWGGAEHEGKPVTVYWDTDAAREIHTDGKNVKEYGSSLEMFCELLKLREEGLSNDTLAIIGGADGPTAIFLAGKLQ
ncbi:MAG: M56 family metallopeptidase [Eubacteriales bacterium]|nr:M56 family metallopeptidase [Eubacteriales bacterium]